MKKIIATFNSWTLYSEKGKYFIDYGDEIEHLGSVSATEAKEWFNYQVNCWKVDAGFYNV